jgi:putative glycosyltransferase (TIGR04348 family)
MRIILITPAPPRSRAGNRATATRWANILQRLGHRVDIATEYHGQDTDLMLALHAWRSAAAIEQFARKYPQRPLIVAITGTDAYRFIHSHPEPTLRSIELADQLVGLHDLIANTLPPEARHKMNVIVQSAQPIAKRNPYRRFFHVSVMGHLRDEKDPLRPALAARLLPDSSRIQIHQYGKAVTDDWAKAAQAEVQTNPRYHWHQELPHYKIRQVYQRTNLLVLPSRMEGGANVISEAVVAGVPVVASDIEGSIGLLGAQYPGYYALESEAALAEMLLHCEQDEAFLQQLLEQGQQQRERYSPQHELNGWRELLNQFD